jgi:fructose-1-phosphate kinase PfkB-like protein
MFLTLCVNPVLDLLFHSRGFSSENRVFFDELVISAGGFGPNAARALRCLGKRPECYIVSGGGSGRLIREALENEGIKFRGRRIKDSTRIAAHWLAGNNTRMLVSPSPRTGSGVLRRVFEGVLRSVRRSDVVLIGGSVPTAIEPEFVRLVAELSSKLEHCCFDVRTRRWRDLVAGRPFILKLPNTFVERPVEECASLLHEAVLGGARLALCNIGRTSFLARTRNEFYRIESPEVALTNPYGAGDCLIAVLAAALHDGATLRGGLRIAAAAAAASVGTPIPGQFDPGEANRLTRKVCIVPLLRIRR